MHMLADLEENKEYDRIHEIRENIFVEFVKSVKILSLLNS